MAAPTPRRPRRSSAVLDDALADGHVLLDPGSGEYFRVEGSAAAVWDLCDGERDEAAIAAEVALRFGADPAAVAGDVGRFLDACAAAGLVTFDAPPPGRPAAG